MVKLSRNEILKELGRTITFQYDYPPTGEGWVGYKGHNMYRFKVDNLDEITEKLITKSHDYENEFNVSTLAQEIISDLLEEGLIEYGGYGYKSESKNTISI